MPPEKLADLQSIFSRCWARARDGPDRLCTILTLPSRLAFEKAGSVELHLDGAEVRVTDDGRPRCACERHWRTAHARPECHVTLSRAAGSDRRDAALAVGYKHTGDIGYLDDDGFLFLVDRKKDMIIRGGENVYRAKSRTCSTKQTGVAQAAVVAARSELFGEEVFAFVVRR